MLNPCTTLFLLVLTSRVKHDLVFVLVARCLPVETFITFRPLYTAIDGIFPLFFLFRPKYAYLSFRFHTHVTASITYVQITYFSKISEV
jgi:hypothetical protein